MAGRLEGKVAVITGGCSGIGLGTVELFAAEGAFVVAADLQDEKGTMLERRFPDRVRYAHCDVTDPAQIKAAIDRAPAEFGGLDILFNNAGAGGAPGGVEETTPEGWDFTFALLLRAPALGMTYALPHLRARGGGSIINTASIAGLQAGYGPLAYSTAKAGVIHMSRVAATQLARDKVRVNAICPGLIATSIFGVGMGLPVAVADQAAARIAEGAHRLQPIPKSGLPEDIARACLYLASDDSLFVTGTHIVVDGGLTTGPRSAWDPQATSPLLDALGITPEPAQQMQAARAAAAAQGQRTSY